MRFPRARIRACAAVSAGAFALVLVLTPSAARAQEKTYVMKVTGPTINDAPHLLAKYFAEVRHSPTAVAPCAAPLS